MVSLKLLINVRSKIQQDMMRPKSALFYLDELQVVADDFIEYILRRRDPETLVNGNFLRELHQWAFESISLAAIDQRMGLLEPNPDEEIKRLIKAVEVIVDGFADLAFGVPLYKILPNPRWHGNFRKCEDAFNVAVDIIKVRLAEAIKIIEDKKVANGGEYDSEGSILEKFLRKTGPDSPIPKVSALDMVFAGIDTTGNSSGFLLYNLAMNPDKQELLRKEMQGLSEPMTERDAGKTRYLRACLKESMRVYPTVDAMIRVLPEDLVIRGYNVPKGTLFMWQANILGRDPKYFDNPDEFMPERWLNPESKKKIHAFTTLPFSYGPRMCIGKRFAELEIQVLMYKILKRFRVEWAGSPGSPMETFTKLTNEPNQELKFKFIEL